MIHGINQDSNYEKSNFLTITSYPSFIIKEVNKIIDNEKVRT